jgi:lipopolysaccharide export system protein LptC
MKRPIRCAMLTLGLTGSLLLTGCGSNPLARWFSPIVISPSAESSGEDLSFTDINLEQVNPEGEKIWTLDAEKVTYEDDKQLAALAKPSGILFRSGKASYRVSGDRGTVNETASELTLEGNVVLKLLTVDGQVEGEKLTWKPNEARFILEGNLKGHYQTVNFGGQRAELQEREQQLALSEEVTADLTTDRTRLRTTALTWNIGQNLVQGVTPVVLEHYAEQNPGQVLDRATGDGIRVDLKQRQFRLSPNAVIHIGADLDADRLEIRSQTLVWDRTTEVISSDSPITIAATDGSKIRGNTGEFNLKSQIATLVGSIEAQHQNPLGNLWADRVQWQVNTDRVEATGAVRYEQPSTGFKMEGTQAIGNLASQDIQVKGSQQVRTQYVIP